MSGTAVAMTESLPDASLYWCRVMHDRLAPFRHKFVYRVFSLLVDIDRLEQVAAQTRLFRYNRAGLFSFFDKDHGARDGSALRPWVEAALHRHGLADAAARIRLFCFPRLFGFVFNPLSVYFCYDAAERLRAILYEVKNTFGDQHGYLLEVPRGSNATKVVQQQIDKGFYVSPFLPFEGRYDFRILPPGEKIAIHIRQTGADGAPQLIATQTGQRSGFSDRALLGALLRHPLMTVKVIAGIHWEALHLWRKGAAFFRRPEPPAAAVTFGNSQNGPTKPR